MDEAFRILRRTVPSAELLDREFAEHLAHGVLFVPGAFSLVRGEAVLVWLELSFADRTLELAGRVAQAVPEALASVGGHPGVAILLEEEPERLRARLEDGIQAELSRPSAVACARRAERSPAIVPARVCSQQTGALEGLTRNLSLSGVLVATEQGAPEVGSEVFVQVEHPSDSAGEGIPGRIARHDHAADGRVRGLGIEFDAAAARDDGAETHLREVKAHAHAQRLGGVRGSLETFGLADLLTSLGRCLPSGRFTFDWGGDAGIVYVQEGRIAAAQTGGAVGLKALVRMLARSGGEFEFHANERPTEASDRASAGLPATLEGALLEATRFLDEDRRRGGAGLPSALQVRPAAGLRTAHSLLGGDEKLECAVLDGVERGSGISSLLDSLQAPDSAIGAAVQTLLERGLIVAERPRSAASVKRGSTPGAERPIRKHAFDR